MDPDEEEYIDTKEDHRHFKDDDTELLVKNSCSNPYIDKARALKRPCVGTWSIIKEIASLLVMKAIESAHPERG